MVMGNVNCIHCERVKWVFVFLFCLYTWIMWEKTAGHCKRTNHAGFCGGYRKNLKSSWELPLKQLWGIDGRIELYFCLWEPVHIHPKWYFKLRKTYWVY